ncbi:unnamed protein product, partial [Arabidopsis halleri]
YKNDKTTLRGTLVNGFYILDGHTIANERCNAESSKVSIKLWHSRLGHMSINNLEILSWKALIEKKEIKDLALCEHCVMEKLKKHSFNVGKHITEDILGYIHADLWGSPNVTPSISCKQYFLSIIDAKSGRLEEKFWAETAATTTYLINRSPASAVDHNVPEQLWLNMNPRYKHLRRFGSIANVHQDQGKLKPRALKGVFLGNVVFNEELVFKDLQSESKPEESSTPHETKLVIEVNSVEKHNAETSDEGGAAPVQLSDYEKEFYNPEGIITGSADLMSYQLARDRVRRAPKPPAKLSNYTQFAFALVMAEDIDSEEPICFHDAKNDKDWEKWNGGISEEMQSLLKNTTWDIVDRPTDQKVISCPWLYKKKPGIRGVEPERFKARLVITRGFSQIKGIIIMKCLHQ